MPERELRDVSEDGQTTHLIAEQVTGFAFQKCLLIGSGSIMSLFGLVGGILDITTNLLNRYVFHLGKEKWLLHDGLILVGCIGVFLIVMAFPSARKFIFKCCRRRNRGRRRNQHRLLIDDVETGQSPPDS